jgi:hypothetical protein
MRRRGTCGSLEKMLGERGRRSLVEERKGTREWEGRRRLPQAERYLAPATMDFRSFRRESWRTLSRYCAAAHELYFSCIPMPLVYPPSGPYDSMKLLNTSLPPS